MTVSYNEFQKLDLRVGKVVSALPFEKAIKPAYKLQIDFGPIGILNSSAQLTANYTPEKLVGLKVVAVVNFPEKQIANFFSQCLVLGVIQNKSGVILLQVNEHVMNGTPVS